MVVGVGIGTATLSDTVPVGVSVSVAGGVSLRGAAEAKLSVIGVGSNVAAQSASEARRRDKSAGLVELAVVDCGIVAVALSLGRFLCGVHGRNKNQFVANG
jgi:hypothetical protein